MIKVPEKFRRCGIRVQCLKCRTEVTDTCHQKGVNIQNCQFKDKHKFKLVVHIPNTSCAKRTRLVATKDFDSALIELTKFKAEVKEEFQVQNSDAEKLSTVPIQNETSHLSDKSNSTNSIRNSKYLILELASKYIDALSGLNTPIHLIRKRSAEHIKETERTIERFCVALSKTNYKIETLDLRQIGQIEVGIFCEYIVNELHISSYNKPCVIMKAFYNWCIDVQDCECKNPFEKLQLSISLKKEKTAISMEEFTNLLSKISYENGFSLKGEKKINVYYPWLSVAFRLALETGLRAEEVVTLRFDNITELQKGVMVFKLINLKVWRIQTGSDHRQIDKYVKYVPITASLNRLLIDCGYEQFKNSDKQIIPFNAEFKTNYAQDIISRAFTHYVKQVTTRKIEYKDLRKTYITYLTMALGDKTKLFTGHSDDAVIQNHYLADTVLMGGLSNLNIFGDCA
jgi:integrase